MKNKIKNILLIVLAILAILYFTFSLITKDNGDWILLVIPLFVICYFLKDKIGNKIKKIKTSLFLKFFIIGLLAGLFTESLVLIGGFGYLHENPLIDFFLFLGFYGSIPIIWYFLLRKYEFSLKQIFILSGIFGVIIEQNFAILLSFNILSYIYVFFVYGSFITISFLLTENAFNKFKRKNKKIKYIIAFFTQFLAYLFGGLWAVTMQIIFEFPNIIS